MLFVAVIKRALSEAATHSKCGNPRLWLLEIQKRYGFGRDDIQLCAQSTDTDATEAAELLPVWQYRIRLTWEFLAF